MHKTRVREREVCASVPGTVRKQLSVDEEGSLEGSERGFIVAASPKRQLSSTAHLLLFLVNFN